MEYVTRTQIRVNEDDRDHWFRHMSKGGWPFSTAAHGWPISDCSAEGLKGVVSCLKLYPQFVPDYITNLSCHTNDSDPTLFHTIDLIISYQNPEGGWATYENRRGGEWYETLNPSEAFSDIMIDFSYVECSSACLTALREFINEVF